MYTSVKSCLKFGQHMTPFFETHGGVKQGDVMSPSLFNWYINDIRDLFDNNDTPVCLGNRELRRRLGFIIKDKRRTPKMS